MYVHKKMLKFTCACTRNTWQNCRHQH